MYIERDSTHKHIISSSPFKQITPTLHQILSPLNLSKMTMEIQTSSPKSNSAASNLSMHKTSQTISKTKPKIRIIHIFAPEIIKTDAANFRELVQRLTGKPTGADPNCDDGRVSSRKKEAKSKKMEMAVRAGSHAEFRERVKEEEQEIWMSANSGGGFLGGFAEFDGFMQEINQFPFLEGTTAQMQDVYGECQLV